LLLLVHKDAASPYASHIHKTGKKLSNVGCCMYDFATAVNQWDEQ